MNIINNIIKLFTPTPSDNKLEETMDKIMEYQKRYDLVIAIEKDLIYLKNTPNDFIKFEDDVGIYDTEWETKEVKLLKYLDRYYGEKNADT